MSKPKNPVLAVLHYFETTELSLALQALALAQATIKRRQQPPRPPVKEKPAPTKSPKADGQAAVSTPPVS